MIVEKEIIIFAESNENITTSYAEAVLEGYFYPSMESFLVDYPESEPKEFRILLRVEELKD